VKIELDSAIATLRVVRTDVCDVDAAAVVAGSGSCASFVAQELAVAIGGRRADVRTRQDWSARVDHVGRGRVVVHLVERSSGDAGTGPRESNPVPITSQFVKPSYSIATPRPG
jgi:hypothetical protein